MFSIDVSITSGSISALTSTVSSSMTASSSGTFVSGPFSIIFPSASISKFGILVQTLSNRSALVLPPNILSAAPPISLPIAPKSPVANASKSEETESFNPAPLFCNSCSLVASDNLDL